MIVGEHLLDTFLTTNILLCLAYGLWLLTRSAMNRLGQRNAHGTQLRLLNWTFLTILLAPLVALGFRELQSIGLATGVTVNLSDIAVSHFLNGGFEMKASHMEALVLARDTLLLSLLTGEGWVAQSIIALFASGLLFGFTRLAVSVVCLRRIVAGSFAWRRFGRIRIRLSERTLVPFSTRGWVYYYVVLPTHMLERPDALRVSLAHEFQHIRQGDLEWEVLLEALKPFFFLNPAFHAWKRQVERLREFDCDLQVLARGHVDLRAYCDTLLSVCQKQLRHDQTFACAVPKVTLVTADRDGRRLGPHPSLVQHRILSMLDGRKPTHKRWLFSGAALPVLLIILLSAVAIQRPGDWSQDRLTLSTVVNLERLDAINRSAGFGRIGN